MKKFAFLFLAAFFCFYPLAMALADGAYNIGTKPVCYSGLVPCGVKVVYCDPLSTPSCSGDVKLTDGKCENYNAASDSDINCEFCHFLIMLKGILGFVFKVVIAIAVLMVVVSGIMLLTCGGSPSCVSNAWSILKATAIGLLIMLASWVVIGTVFVGLGVQEWTGLTKWHEINCPIENTLTVKKAGRLTAASVVTSAPAGINCGSDCKADFDFGATITLTATSNAGWSGVQCDAGNRNTECKFKLEGSKTVTVTF